MNLRSDTQRPDEYDKWQDKASPAHVRETLRRAVFDPDRTGIILDFDGTLAPIAPTPEAVVLGARGQELLRALIAIFPVVAVVSGRTLDDLQGRLGVDGLWLAGDHGAVVQSPDGTQIKSQVLPDLNERLQQALIRLQETPTGVRVERKPRSIALHYRGQETNEALVTALKEQALAVASQLELVAAPGRCLVELRQPGIDKGAAVKTIVERHRLRAVLVGGDDWTDLDAFRMAHALVGSHGIGIAVWSEEVPRPLLAEADAIVLGVSEMTQWLEVLTHRT